MHANVAGAPIYHGVHGPACRRLTGPSDANVPQGSFCTCSCPRAPSGRPSPPSSRPMKPPNAPVTAAAPSRHRPARTSNVSVALRRCLPYNARISGGGGAAQSAFCEVRRAPGHNASPRSVLNYRVRRGGGRSLAELSGRDAERQVSASTRRSVTVTVTGRNARRDCAMM